MEKRSLIAIILSLAIWLIWITLFPHNPQVPVKDTSKKTLESSKSQNKQNQIKEKSTEKKRIRTVIASAGKETEIKLKTDLYTATLSNQGAMIKKFVYNDRNIDLVIKQNKFFAQGNFDFAIHFNENEFIRGSAIDKSLWKVSRESENKVLFYLPVTIENTAFRLEKLYTFLKKETYFKLEVRIVNKSRSDATLPNESFIISPSDFLGPNMDFNNTYNMLSSIYSLNGSYEKPSKGGLFSDKGAFKKEDGTVQWAGIMSRYFLLILVPENNKANRIIYDNREGTGYRAGMYIPVDTIRSGQTVTKSFKVYVGNKDKDKLVAVDASLRDAADVHILIEPIRDFLLWCLFKINLLFGNFGWSIVVFSILSKIVFLPLTQKSTESMKRMQALNPKINDIRTKLKENPQKMNQEIMKLYKKEKVNPAGGCLPLLLQMPFFFALYSALINSVEMWNAPFILWIQDLSLPDTVYTLQGFNINILPIVMTVSTFIQQKMTSGDAQGQQQKMMMMMPLIFIVIFWSMPSGLVLYWTMQNVLQIAHQVYTNRRDDKNK